MPIPILGRTRPSLRWERISVSHSIATAASPTAANDVGSWHSRTLVQLESAKWGKADIDQVAAFGVLMWRVGAGGRGLVLPCRNIVTIRPGLVRRSRVRPHHRSGISHVPL